MRSERPYTQRRVGLGLAALALILGSSLVSSPSVFGQGNGGAGDAPAAAAAADGIDQAKILAGLAVFKEAGCRDCHGWAANGEPEGPNPQGPTLRATTLDFDLVRTTIACGRPGTPMPYFWRDAYRASSTDCYGVTGADLGNQKPDRAATRLNAEEVDAVAYYIASYVKGLGDITFDQCEFFFGVGDAHCPQYAR